jgi:hypothetical protein
MAENVKRSIETAVKPLIGLPLSIAREAADMRIFHFGGIRPHRTGKGTVGSHALHIQCTWRLVDRDGIITGYSDRFYCLDPEVEPNPENLQSGNLQKILIERFMGEFDDLTGSHVDLKRRHVVASVQADQYGSVDIAFTDGVRLQLFPDGSSTEDWRFFATEPPDLDHFAIVGGKIQPDE